MAMLTATDGQKVHKYHKKKTNGNIVYDDRGRCIYVVVWHESETGLNHLPTTATGRHYSEMNEVELRALQLGKK